MIEISHVPAAKNSHWHSVSLSRGYFLKLQITLNSFCNFQDTSGLEINPFYSLMQKNTERDMDQKCVYLSYSPFILMSDQCESVYQNVESVGISNIQEYIWILNQHIVEILNIKEMLTILLTYILTNQINICLLKLYWKMNV